MDTSPPEPFGLLVIGSGPAGIHAVKAYLEAGGPGRVCLVSADHDAPYQRPPLSKAVLAGEEPPEVTPILEDESVLSQVDLRSHVTVTALRPDQRTVWADDGSELRYERLVVATGSTPIELPGARPDATVLGLRTLEDARQLVRAVEDADHVVVVGSGFIGCEAAAFLSRRGVRTTLVTSEPAPQVARLGEGAARRIAGWLTGYGVELHTDVEVQEVRAPATVILADGTRLEADVVLAAVGVDQERPFLAGSGLRLEGGRLSVDETLRTTDPHVWAAGDVALAHHAVAQRELKVEHWGDAVSMGTIAGTNAATSGIRAFDRWSSPPGFWSEIGEHTLKYSAWGDGFDHLELVEHDDEAFTVWYADAAGELVGVLTHDRDEDYERGGDLLARRAPFAER